MITLTQVQKFKIFRLLVIGKTPVSYNDYTNLLKDLIKRPNDNLYNHYVKNFDNIKSVPYDKRNLKLFGFSAKPTTLNYYLDRGYTLEEAQETLRDRQFTLREEKLTCDNPKDFLKKFHKKRLDSIRKKTKDPEHAWKWKDTFWRRHLKNINPDTGLNYTETEAKLYQSKLQSVISKNIDRTNINFSTRVDYWINKGLTYEDALVAFEIDCKRRTFSLEKCIAKYGEIAGLEKWQDRQRRWQETMNSKSPEEKLRILIAKTKRHSFYSKQSVQIFEKLEKLIKTTGLRGENEFFIQNNGKIRFYDFCLLDIKVIVEFNGSHVHPNPNLTKEQKEKWKCPFTKKNFNEKTIEDKNKIKLAKSAGFKVFQIWDTDPIEKLIKIAKQIQQIYDNN